MSDVLGIEPGTVWRHYKGGRYLVLGVAEPTARLPSADELRLGIARHSETGEDWCVYVAVRSTRGRRCPRIMAVPKDRVDVAKEPLVVYVPLYEVPGRPMAVRPLTMWRERVEVASAYGTATVPRFEPDKR